MIIHVVKAGETVESIADTYKKSADRLIKENDIENPDKLVVGQTLIISNPKQTYIVKNGDTLASIAEANSVTIMQILRNNPYLAEREYIFPGETLVISYDEQKAAKISTNGYAYPFIDMTTLRKTLPFLTYVTIFTYNVTSSGDLNDIDDKETINTAKEYGVAPIMLISTTVGEGKPDINVAHNIINNRQAQDRLIDNALSVMKAKGYYGLNIDSHYIYPNDRTLYINFISYAAKRVNDAGYKFFVTITPSGLELSTGRVDEDVDYSALGKSANGVALLHYSWGHTSELPVVLMPFEAITHFLDYAVTQIPPDKIYFGLTSIGYVFELPYTAGVSTVDVINYSNAIQLAAETNAVIQFDEISQASYFYVISSNREYLNWFRDARGFDNIIKLVPLNGIKGINIWNIMSYLAQLMMLINLEYDIDKVI